MHKSRPNFTVGIDASRAAADRPTGVERYAFEVIQRLKGIVPADVAVRLYAEAPLTGPLADLPPNWTVRVLPWRSRWFWAELRLGWEMLVRPPDVLWQPARSLPFVLPRRTLVTVHDLGFLDYPTAYGLINRWYQIVSAWLEAKRASVLTVSEYTAGRVRRWFGEPRRGMTVVPLAAEADVFAAAADDAAGQAERRARYGLAQPYFLFVGRLETKKNIDGLLAAFARISAQAPEVELVLSGGRGLGFEPALASLPASLRARVRELGYVPAEDLPYLYAASLGLAFPSRYEGFGIPVLEAFAARVPVLTANAASLPEVAGGAALTVSPENVEEIAAGLLALSIDDALRHGLVDRGVARLAAFSWQTTAERTWDVIKGLMKR